MEIFHFKLYRKRLQPRVSYRLKRLYENSLKSAALLLKPAWPTAIIVIFWYKVIFLRKLHFDQEMENIVTAAWIPTFGFLYSLLAAIVFNTVWGEYKAIRTAVKRGDIETFVDLKDEGISPLIYMLVSVCSASIIGAFMSLKYHNAICGGVVVGTTVYLLALVYFVVKEIDDPCGGFWFIKSIPPEWLELDVKRWRSNRYERERRKITVMIAEMTTVETAAEKAEPTSHKAP